MSSSHQNVSSLLSKKITVMHDDKHGDDSSSDEEPQARIRVGEMYQAKVPQWQYDNVPGSDKIHSKEGMLIWLPSSGLPEDKLDSYCQLAKEKHSYNVEQALGMLFWHKHDIKKSLNDMQNFTPMPDDWSVEDKVLFEQAYTFHGKNFRKIQQLIPDKDICQLVKHYYTWKKSRMKTSLIDKQAVKRRHDDSDDSTAEENDLSPTMENNIPPFKQRHMNTNDESKHKLPQGIQLTHEDLQAFARDPKAGEGHLQSLDNKLIELKRQVQTTKQECGKLITKLGSFAQSSADESHADEWSDVETKLALEGIKRLGEQYDEIAFIVGTKTSEQVREMFNARRDELKIDELLPKRKTVSESSAEK